MLSLVPLRKYRDFRLLFFSQLISYFGNMVSYVVVPFQVYELTKSSVTVGLLGFVQLVPVLVFGLLGGSLADRVDRRFILIVCELIMAVCSFGLVANAAMPHPNLIAIFVLIFFLQSASAYHRPATEAMTQKMVPLEDFSAVATLNSLRFAVTAIVGPAFGGWVLSMGGTVGAYLFDFTTFVVALICAFFISDRYTIAMEKSRGFWTDLKEGIHFAISNRPLLGSYLVDIMAMMFAFPIALFPEIAEKNNYSNMIGWLYAGMAIGALVITLGFAKKISDLRRRGVMITLSAAIWGVGIVLFGYSLSSIWLSIFFLAVAGAADTVSGLQRKILWNEIIPNDKRGRLAGLEMISYMSGPLIGNFRAGIMSGYYGIRASVAGGGVVCILGVLICAFLIPQYWKYKSAE